MDDDADAPALAGFAGRLMVEDEDDEEDAEEEEEVAEEEEDDEDEDGAVGAKTRRSIGSGKSNGLLVMGSTNPSAIPHATSGESKRPQKLNPPSRHALPVGGLVVSKLRSHRRCKQAGRSSRATGVR